MGRRTIRRSIKNKRKSRVKRSMVKRSMVRRSMVKKWGGVYPNGIKPPIELRTSGNNIISENESGYYSPENAFKIKTGVLNKVIKQVIDKIEQELKLGNNFADVTLDNKKYEIEILPFTQEEFRIRFKFTYRPDNSKQMIESNLQEVNERSEPTPSILSNGARYNSPPIKFTPANGSSWTIPTVTTDRGVNSKKLCSEFFLNIENFHSSDGRRF